LNNRSLAISAGPQRRVDVHNSASKSRAETAVVVVSVMKRMSMNVFTAASRTQGVGHRLGEAGIFLRMKAEFEPE